MPDNRPLSDLRDEQVFSRWDAPRAAAHAIIQRILGSPQDEPKPPSLRNSLRFTKPDDAPELITHATGDSFGGAYVNDPTMELAVQLFRSQYPNAYKRVGALRIGEAQPPGIGGTTAPSIVGTPIVSMAPTSKERIFPDEDDALTEDLDTLRHEFAHVVGLPDFADPRDPNPFTAYDLGGASHQLHKDIELEPDRALRIKKLLTK
jgi:hypothetical protein